MTLYSLFRFHEYRLVDTLDHEFGDDLDALDAARNLSDEHTIEVYSASRFVARVKQGDEPIHVKDGNRRDSGQPVRNDALREEQARAELIVTEARDRVATATDLMRERQRLSDMTIGQTWEACRQSKTVIEQSRKALARLDKKGVSSWDPLAPKPSRR